MQQNSKQTTKRNTQDKPQAKTTSPSHTQNITTPTSIVQTPRSNRAILKFWIIGLLMIFIGYVFFQSLEIIYLIITAYIISAAMDTVINRQTIKKIPRGVAILISYMILLSIGISGFLIIIPFMLTQISEILSNVLSHISHRQVQLQTNTLPELIQYSSNIPEYMKPIILSTLDDPGFVSSLQYTLQQNISQLLSLGTTYVKNVGNIAVGVVTNFFNVITKIAIVLTLAVLFSIEKNAVVEFIANIRGPTNHDFVYTKIEKMYKKLGTWLKSQLFLSLYIGGIVWISLWILERFGMPLPHKGSLALISGLTEFIPYLGPILGSIPAVLLAIIYHGWRGAIIFISVFLVIQWTENNILIPVMMNKTLGVNPVLIFISMIIGALVIGFVGVLLAVPFALILTIIFDKTFE